MKDRTGELSEGEIHVLNHELMPLVDECLEQAHERNPELRGMLAVNVDLASAEGIGGIFESAEADPQLNELHDDELLECVRQSSFSVQLPEAGRSGRMSRQLTIPFGVSPAGDAGR